MKTISQFLILFFTLALFISTSIASGNNENELADKASLSKLETIKQRLENIDVTLKQTGSTLKKQLRQYKKAVDESHKNQIQADISNTRIKINELNQSFVTLSTGGIQFNDAVKKSNTKLDWQADLMEIIKPLFTAMKDITKKPREIDNLKRQIDTYHDQLKLNNQALAHIEQLEKLAFNKTTKIHLQAIKKQRLQEKKNDERHKNVSQFQLDELLNNKESVLDATNQKFKSFITGKGLTLLIAITVFSLILVAGNYLQRSLDNKAETKHLKFSQRLRRIIFRAATIIFAMFALLVVFYIRNDWLFMGLAFIFFIGAAFSLKNTLPQYINEIKMLLNISTVREGERIIYNGIAWKVETLNIQSTLVNPCLRGGKMRMSLRQLASLHSRPYDKNEPWFPCNENDYVVLDAGQGQFGQILLASPEFVEMRALGGSIITIPTAEFIALNPSNISNKTFSVRSIFGIDYGLQKISTTEVITIFENELAEQIKQEKYGQYFIKVEAEFNSANASSIDYKLIAHFEGAAAKHYRYIGRHLQKFAVNVCNNNNWSIPYQQIVLHKAN